MCEREKQVNSDIGVYRRRAEIARKKSPARRRTAFVTDTVQKDEFSALSVAVERVQR